MTRTGWLNHVKFFFFFLLLLKVQLWYMSVSKIHLFNMSALTCPTHSFIAHYTRVVCFFLEP